MKNPTSSLLLLVFLLIFACLCEIIVKADEADDSKVYIIYLGHKPHDDHELITDSHHDILSQVAGSKEEAKKLMMYSYRHGFSGFAAKLTNSQAKQIGELPDVVRVIKNPLYTTHTSRSWDFLGLSRNSPNNLLNKTNQGDGMIIGVLDSGISGESEAFNDNGMGPIPSRWKGLCKSEANFNATIHCNKKIIGARWYIKGFMEEKGLTQSIIDKTYNLSAVDASGHGSHCASTAAGSYVNNLQYYGLNMGTIRGGAPLARLAIYKSSVRMKSMYALVFRRQGHQCPNSMTEDGVDIISASIGDIFINIAEVNEESVLGIGSYHAVSHGISVIAAGGNSGPDSNTISNTAPWVITVAASNSDRQIVTPLTLGNNKTILGDGLFREQIFGPLITFHNITKGEQVKFIANEVKGKVLLVFFQQADDILASLINLKTSGVLAIIVSIPPFDEITDYNQLFGIPIPNVYVDLEQGNQIYDYFQRSKSNNQDPMIKLGRSEMLEGQEVVLKVPKFSSRGPNAFAPEILKPDIAAPGVDILAAVRPQKGDHGFQLMSGTSMAAPHVSGIVALLKVAHPDWSPAAIKSALITTAWNEDTYKSEIYSEGAGDKIADPFDFGGGICNPNGATDPGLVYDMDKNDYLNYLCSLGYSNDKMQNATTLFSKTKNSTSSGIICPNKVPSRLDLNLPSISIPNLKNSVTIKRTVTNVGNVNAIYKVVIKPPRNTVVKVSPHIVKFNSKTKKISFEVKITSTHQRMSKFTFGSLAWNDGKHFVRIPIAVRKQVDV
ncbi:hypothetical protein MTR67_042637 [Solanum verrucosum]|uniref:Uncharacterized protein n=1 Tax=Solanum verrucosum TaxID=315347 RepID=A0AAF0UMY3_SOLVR|nr:hypothetical protein MTR67_042637 [Solanum verrucosum]